MLNLGGIISAKCFCYFVDVIANIIWGIGREHLLDLVQNAQVGFL